MTQQLRESYEQETPVFGPQPPGEVVTDEIDRDTAAPIRRTGRKGFLPIRTNTWDRGFISVVCFVAIHLLWMRFVEAYIPLFVATILSIALAVIIIRRG